MEKQCLETSCPSTVLTLSAAISFSTASSPQGLTPGVEGKSRECPHHCHHRGSLEEGMRRYECSKGRSSRNSPAPGTTLCFPEMLPASLHVAPLPCTCQHSVELLTLGPLFTAVFLFKQLEKLKGELSAEDGSEVAYALESLSASQPKKRGRFWVWALEPSCPLLFPGLPLCNKDSHSKHAPNMLKSSWLAAFRAVLALSYSWWAAGEEDCVPNPVCCRGKYTRSAHPGPPGGRQSHILLFTEDPGGGEFCMNTCPQCSPRFALASKLLLEA